MATLNINRSVTDMFYRYKMPKVIVKVSFLIIFANLTSYLLTIFYVTSLR